MRAAGARGQEQSSRLDLRPSLGEIADQRFSDIDWQRKPVVTAAFAVNSDFSSSPVNGS